jgi:hypothetical protein
VSSDCILKGGKRSDLPNFFENRNPKACFVIPWSYIKLFFILLVRGFGKLRPLETVVKVVDYFLTFV